VLLPITLQLLRCPKRTATLPHPAPPCQDRRKTDATTLLLHRPTGVALPLGCLVSHARAR